MRPQGVVPNRNTCWNPPDRHFFQLPPAVRSRRKGILRGSLPRRRHGCLHLLVGGLASLKQLKDFAGICPDLRRLRLCHT